MLDVIPDLGTHKGLSLNPSLLPSHVVQEVSLLPALRLRTRSPCISSFPVQVPCVGPDLVTLCDHLGRGDMPRTCLGPPLFAPHILTQPNNSPVGTRSLPWKPPQVVLFEILSLSTLGEGHLLPEVTSIPSHLQYLWDKTRTGLVPRSSSASQNPSGSWEKVSDEVSLW